MYKQRFWKTCIDQPSMNFVKVPKDFFGKCIHCNLSFTNLWGRDKQYIK